MLFQGPDIITLLDFSFVVRKGRLPTISENTGQHKQHEVEEEEGKEVRTIQ